MSGHSALLIIFCVVISGCVSNQRFTDNDNKICMAKSDIRKTQQASLRSCVNNYVPAFSDSESTSTEIAEAVMFKCADEINKFSDSVHDTTICNMAQQNNQSIGSVLSTLPSNTIHIMREKGAERVRQTVITEVVEYRAENK